MYKNKITLVAMLIGVTMISSGCKILDIIAKSMDEFDKAAQSQSKADDIQATENLVQEIVKYTRELKSTVLSKEQLFQKLKTKEKGLYIVDETIKMEEIEPYATLDYTIVFANSLKMTVVTMVPRTADKNIVQVKITDLIDVR